MSGSACNQDLHLCPRDEFDPAAWHRVYGDPDASPAQQLFQRVTDEVSQAALPLVNPGDLWLDLGCGTGELSRKMAGCGAQLWGVDHDPSMLQWAKDNVVCALPVKFLAADVTRIPCDRSSVDGIAAASLTGCLEDADSFMRELSRILVPGGHAVLSFTNRESLFLSISNWRHRRKSQHDAGHPCHGRFRRYHVDDVIRTVRKHGFHLVLARHFNCFMDFSKRAFPSIEFARNLERLPIDIIRRRMCRNFVLVLKCQKPARSSRP